MEISAASKYVGKTWNKGKLRKMERGKVFWEKGTIPGLFTILSFLYSDLSFVISDNHALFVDDKFCSIVTR